MREAVADEQDVRLRGGGMAASRPAMPNSTGAIVRFMVSRIEGLPSNRSLIDRAGELSLKTDGGVNYAQRGWYHAAMARISCFAPLTAASRAAGPIATPSARIAVTSARPMKPSAPRR